MRRIMSASVVRVRRRPRCWLPSYLRAISSRYQRSSVSGVTMHSSSASVLRASALHLPRLALVLARHQPLGRRQVRVKVLGADGKSLSVEIQGGALSLPWTRLSAGDRLNLARAFLKESVFEDHVLVAVFALADGRADLSDEHFAKAKAADPKGGKARVAEVRASLGLK